VALFPGRRPVFFDKSDASRAEACIWACILQTAQSRPVSGKFEKNEATEKAQVGKLTHE
jgi:hypothetical protein